MGEGGHGPWVRSPPTEDHLRDLFRFRIATRCPTPWPEGLRLEFVEYEYRARGWIPNNTSEGWPQLCMSLSADLGTQGPILAFLPCGHETQLTRAGGWTAPGLAAAVIHTDGDGLAAAHELGHILGIRHPDCGPEVGGNPTISRGFRFLPPSPAIGEAGVNVEAAARAIREAESGRDLDTRFLHGGNDRRIVSRSAASKQESGTKHIVPDEALAQE